MRFSMKPTLGFELVMMGETILTFTLSNGLSQYETPILLVGFAAYWIGVGHYRVLVR